MLSGDCLIASAHKWDWRFSHRCASGGRFQTFSKRPIRPLIFRERHPDLRQPQARANVLQWRSFSDV